MKSVIISIPTRLFFSLPGRLCQTPLDIEAKKAFLMCVIGDNKPLTGWDDVVTLVWPHVLHINFTNCLPLSMSSVSSSSLNFSCLPASTVPRAALGSELAQWHSTHCAGQCLCCLLYIHRFAEFLQDFAIIHSFYQWECKIKKVN